MGPPLVLLQRQPEKGGLRPAAVPAEEEPRRTVLVCAFCGQRITNSAARIAVGGSHEHTFTNPHGLRFHIGCFAAVTGCAVAGQPTTYFTWFSGIAWQVEHCGACGEHLGWLFRSADGVFHGLILDRLREVDEAG